MFFLIGILFFGAFVISIENPPEITQIGEGGRITIIDNGAEWTHIQSTGAEENFTIWVQNENLKKTQIGFILKPNTTSSLVDRQLTYQNGTPILDDKDKEITLKYESSKCDGQDCYYKDLTLAESVNIDDFIKLGFNSSIVVYQNLTTLQFVKTRTMHNNDTNTTYEEDDYYVNVTLKRNSSEGFKIFPDEIWIGNVSEEKFKFGANDYGTTEDELYQYSFISDERIIKFGGEYFVGGRIQTYTNDFGTRYKLLDSNKIDLSDICTTGGNCSFNLEFDYDTNISTLEVDFTGFYNETLGMTVIDPTFTLTDSRFTSNTIAFFNNTVINNSGVHLINFSQNGTFSRILELRDYDYNFNTTGQVSYWKLDDSLTDEFGVNNGTFNGGLTACNVKGVNGFGQSCDFDGTDDYINIAESPELDLMVGTDEFTISLWFKTDGALSNNGYILSKVNIAQQQYAIIAETDNDIIVYSGDADPVARGTYIDSEWTHVALSATTTNYDFYVNGVLTAEDISFAGTENASGVDVLFGARRVTGNTGSAIFFDGKIDNVIIYNRSLSADEVYEDFYADPLSNQFVHNMSCDFQTKDAVLTMHLDESSPTQIDSSGFGNDGTVSGAVFNSSGYYDGAYQFDGSNDYITATVTGHNNNLVSIGAWIFIPLASQTNKYIIDHNNVRSMLYGFQTDAFNIFNNGYPTGTASDTQMNATVGAWNHVVYTSDGSRVYGYLNGVNLVNVSGNLDGTPTTMYLGSFTGISNFFNGTIDEVNIYDRLLSADEVIEANNSGVPWKGKNVTNVSINLAYSNQVQEVQNETDLVGYWRLNENRTGIGNITDYSGNDNNGTVNGNPVFRNNTRCFFEDGCWDFDGVDDIIKMGDQANLDGMTNLTISFWVNQKTLSTQRMVSKWGTSVGERSYVVESAATDEVDVLFSGDGTNFWNIQTTTSPLATSNTWYYVTATFDGSGGNAHIYVNGIDQAITTISGTAPSSIFAGPAEFWIGQNEGHSGFLFNGTIDSVRIYNRSLSEDEIKYNYFHANLSSFTTPVEYSCTNGTILPGITSTRFILYNASLNTSDLDFTPIFNSISLEYNNISQAVAIEINITLINPPNGTRSNSSNQNFTLNATINNGTLTDGFLYIWNQSGDVLFRETVIETADASRVVVGDDLSGDWQNTTIKDGIVMHVGEIGSQPGQLFFFNFTNMTGKDDLWNISLFAQYKGAAADDLMIFLFNQTGGTWDNTTFEIESGNELEWHTFFFESPADYISAGGVVQMAINHTTPGSGSHYSDIDFLSISNEFPYSGSINLTDFDGIETGIEKTLSSGNYTWNYNVFDNESNNNWSSSNFSLVIDLISPTVNILYPLDGSSIFGNLTFQANFSVSDTQSPIDTCWYNLNGNITNTTIPSCNNFTITTINTSNTLIIYANDSVGNEGFDTSTFTVSEIIPSKLIWNWSALMEDKLLPTEICFSTKAGDICFDSPITAAAWQLVSGILKPINSSSEVQIDNNFTVNGSLTVQGGGVNISLDGDQSLVINGNPREATQGHVRIEHKPAVSGTTPLRIIVDAAGFGVIGTIIDYTANDWTDENSAAGIRINFDTSNATGGHFNAFHITKSGNGTARVDALDIRSGINVIHHHSGSEGNITIAFLFDNSTSIFTTVTSEFNNASENTSLFDGNNDAIYIGDELPFDQLKFILDIVASQSINPLFEHSNGSNTWREFEVGDGTNGMQSDGSITFPNTIVDLWETGTVNGITDKYWIRITRTRNALSTVPVEQLVQRTRAVEYEWDSEGNLIINNLRLRGGQINFDSGNYTVLGTNSTMRLFQNPTAEFGFKIFSIEDVIGDTGLSIVQAGPNRASSSKRSFLIGNDTSFCNNVTDLIDCNTSTTGADLWVADDIALGGSLFAANGKFNVTDDGGLDMSGNLDMNGNNITNVSHLFVSNISGNSPVTILDSNGDPLIIFDEDNSRKIMVNATITENIFDVDGNIGFFFENNNNGTNASTLISLFNDAGNNMTMGISGSNFDLVNETNNSGFIFLNSPAPLILANNFNQSIKFMNNPSNDGNPENLKEIVSIGESGIGLIIKKLIGQITNLFEIRDENENVLLSVDSSGNLNVTENITSKNVFIPQYVFVHTNETINLTTVNVWENITFHQEVTDIIFGIEHNSSSSVSHLFNITESGIYSIGFDFDVEDTSASSTDIDVAGRVIFQNGTEIIGSVFETDITKKNIEIEISHTILARVNKGDVLIFQFIASDVDVVVSTHGTFGDHPDSVTIFIEKTANI